MHIDESFISKRISELRIQKNVSARDMSLSLGQSESYINKIENQRTLPSMSGFLYICEYLQISPSDFFKDNIENPMMTKELISEINKLSADKSKVILDLIRVFNK